MLIFDFYMFYLDFIYFHVFCTIVSIFGFIVKIKNPNFICSCVLVDPMVDYWITDLYARGTQDLLFMVLMVMGSLLGFRAISPLLKICSINATEKSHYIFLAFICFSIRLSGCFGFSGASGYYRWLGLRVIGGVEVVDPSL
ncbi:hypothetical protein Hanom_Chr12g01130041 [Helianthus anomalus]